MKKHNKIRVIYCLGVCLVAAASFFATAGMAKPWEPEDLIALDDPISAVETMAVPLCSSISVSNEKRLNKAIAVFNAEDRSCYHKITLTADIYLTKSTTPIRNNHARLIIEGDGFSVDGQDLKGVRPFEIKRDTEVATLNITITGGNGGGTRYAGGILNYGSLTLIDSFISDNSATSGGGIVNGGLLTLINSTISGNRAHKKTYQGVGGGISHRDDHARTIISKSTISGNYADYGGGMDIGGVIDTGPVTIIDSTFSGNQAVKNGGGITTCKAEVSITNSTFSKNKARRNNSEGGGIYIVTGEVKITNSTIAGNQAGQSGGGITNLYGDLYLNNSIIADSTNGDCMISAHADASITAFNNLIQDSGADACHIRDHVDGNITGVDPRIGDLADNGGPTKTHALLKASLAIDAGDDDLAVDPDGLPLVTDQRGAARIWGFRVDIGSYEAFALFNIFRKEVSGPAP